MERLDRIEKIIEENALAMAELRKSQQETGLQIDKLTAENQINQKENEIFVRKEISEITETDDLFEYVDNLFSHLGISGGDAAEEFFYNALDEKKELGGVKFDEITKNVKQKKHRLEEEYDIFMENGNSVAIVEVKHKVKKDHLEKLIAKKAENFRILFPDYSNYKLYVGIAGLAFEPKTEEYATENGIVVLKQKGNVMEVNSKQMRAF